MQSVPRYQVWSPNRELEQLVFSFFPNGASQPVAASFAGYVSSVTRTGVGRFDAVVPDVGILIGMEANLRNPGGSLIDIIALVFGYNPATRTISIALQDVNTGAGTNAATDVAADANSQVLVKCYFDGDVA